MRIGTVVLALGLLLGACGGGPGETPEETFNAFKSAFEGEDWAALWEIMSPRMRGQFSKRVEGKEDEVARDLQITIDEVKAMSDEELFVKGVEFMSQKKPDEVAKQKTKVASLTFLGAEIEGDKAKVRFKLEGRERSTRMIRVDGKWHIDDDDIF